MTPQQVVASCKQRDITLFVRDNGRVGYRGPKEVVTPKLLAVLGGYHDAIKKVLTEAQNAEANEIAELAEQGALVDAHIAQCEVEAPQSVKPLHSVYKIGQFRLKPRQARFVTAYVMSAR